MTYIPISPLERDAMLETIGVKKLEDLFKDVPSKHRFPDLKLPPAATEMEAAAELGELSTANDFSAHLARVAVLPQFQHEHIGHQLVEDMIDSFFQKGISSITVNTQSTNHASLRLYKKIGFRPTGDQFPVYGLPI